MNWTFAISKSTSRTKTALKVTASAICEEFSEVELFVEPYFGEAYPAEAPYDHAGLPQFDSAT